MSYHFDDQYNVSLKIIGSITELKELNIWTPRKHCALLMMRSFNTICLMLGFQPYWEDGTIILYLNWRRQSRTSVQQIRDTDICQSTSFLVGLLVIRRSIFTIILEIKYWHRRSILRRKFQREVEYTEQTCMYINQRIEIVLPCSCYRSIQPPFKNDERISVYALFFLLPSKFLIKCRVNWKCEQYSKKWVQPKVLWT